MKRIYILLTTIAILCSCTNYDEFDVMDSQDVKENIGTVFGIIDPDQDWSSLSSGQVTVTANAPLTDIVKVQILTESPFGNTNARVLCEATAKQGETLTLSYDAPVTSTRLFAACVSSNGIYHIKGFAPGQQTVNFTTSSAQARTRATEASLPSLSSLVLKRRWQSINSLRAQSANSGETGVNAYISLWKNSGWENDYRWALDDGTEQKLIETVDNFTADEKKDLDYIFDTWLERKSNNGKPDNLQKILDSKIFSTDNNYLTADGNTILTVTPVSMASFETREGCHLYYFYFDPSKTNGMSEAEEVQFIKDLPKYKAIQCWRMGWFVAHGYYDSDNIYRRHVYTLPYYGDGTPVQNQTSAVSYYIPAGYKIGFVQRMIKQGENNYNAEKTGELFGDGRLNNEINLYPNHFTSAKLSAGDPRQAIFGLNGKTYVTFEDGSDRQFSDMILEIDGVRSVEEPQNVDNIVFTMCFEDSPVADYDMNDVVIRAKRVDETHVRFSLVACGAYDELYLRGINGQVLNGTTEIHALFGLSTTQQFVNTEADAHYYEPIEETVEVDASQSLEDILKQVYVYDKTKNRDIRVAGKGEDPHAIIVPCEFAYPLEKQCINNVYRLFRSWANNATGSIDWFLYPEDGKTYSRTN